MKDKQVKIYIGNDEYYYPKGTELTGLQVIQKVGKDPSKHTVQYKKTQGQGHPYEELPKTESVELKNNMSFKVIEDIENGKKN